MIQGETASIRIDSIIINRGERLRSEIEPKALASLAESIGRLGLIHFPIVRRDLVLVSGENRIEAMRLLGWDRTTITWADATEEDELLALELEENVKRSDLSWQEQCDGVRRYHELQKRRDPAWTQELTAAGLGVAQATVSSYLDIASEIAKGNQRVLDAPLLSTARNIVARKKERAASDEALQLKFAFGGEEETAPRESPIIQADFLEWAEAYKGQPFNFLHCDFPYGINADKFNQSAGAELGDYKDDFGTYERLLDCLCERRSTLLGESGHLIFWFSMQHYAYTLEKLSRFFRVDPYPLIWIKTDNKGTLPDPSRGPRRIYEVAFFCSHGDRKITSPVSNAYGASTERTAGHMSEKSQGMLEHFFRMVVDEGTRMLDPTCGSGSAIRAADALGAKHVLGLERDAEFVANARRAWENRSDGD